jgi:zinc transport system substrate-binding protein
MAPRSRLLGAGLVALAVAASACSAPGGGSDASSSADGLSVAASFYPLQYVAERVGGDTVDVTNLTKPGAEPHDLELAPQDVAALAEADLALYLRGFQPAVDDAVAGASTASLDVADAANLSLTSSDGAVDPHFWLDPMRLADVGDAVADRLSDLDPDRAETYAQNADSLRSDLSDLDQRLADGLASCRSRLLVTSHTAFGYLADAYGLEQVGLTGLTPETEPTPSDLADLTDFVRDNDVQTIFYETLVSPDVAETVARATGARTAVLDPIEGLTDASSGDDYLSIMDDDLQALRQGLDCR